MIEPISPDEAMGPYEYGDLVYPIVNDILRNGMIGPNTTVFVSQNAIVEILHEEGLHVTVDDLFTNAYINAGWKVEKSLSGWYFSKWSKGQP